MAEPQTRRKSKFRKNLRQDTSDVLAKLLEKSLVINVHDMVKAREIQKKIKWKASIAQILIRIEAISEDELVEIVSSRLSTKIVDPTRITYTEEFLKAFPLDVLKKYMFFPVAEDNKVLHVGMLDPADYSHIEMITAYSKKTVKADVLKESVLLNAFTKYYKMADTDYENLLTLGGFRSIPGVRAEEEAGFDDESVDFNELISMASEEIETVGDEAEDQQAYNSEDAAIIKLANGILLQAIGKGVSDIHLEPFERSFQVRFRVDGTLHKAMALPTTIKAALVSRFKIMSNLDITEKRKPQDGRIKLKVGKNRAIDFRVSVLPTMFGEGVVLRILDHSKVKVGLRRLGFEKQTLEKFLAMCARPQGMVMVVGPTGSGKTNTLYSAINMLNKPDVKILTVEDPVEFNFPGINQVNVNPVAGLTFSTVLRTFLRQDPEIILVGEVRDPETGEIALKAAMTGHLVFTTLHTNDGPSTVARLLNLGLPGYLISSAISGVLAQRLVKKICRKCKVEITHELTKEQIIDAGVDVEVVDKFRAFKGKGCAVCEGTGYKGRIAIFELMVISEHLKDAINAAATEADIRHIALTEGTRTLRRDALDKVKLGFTTLDEALRRTVLVADRVPAYLADTHELIFEHGDCISKEGAKETHFYQLLQGNLLVMKGTKMVGEITKPNEFFCEMSPLFREVRKVSINSNGRSVVRFFPGHKLKEVIEHSPEFGMSMLSKLTERVKDL